MSEFSLIVQLRKGVVRIQFNPSARACVVRIHFNPSARAFVVRIQFNPAARDMCCQNSF
jgi:hypothetical protein